MTKDRLWEIDVRTLLREYNVAYPEGGVDDMPINLASSIWMQERPNRVHDRLRDSFKLLKKEIKKEFGRKTFDVDSLCLVGTPQSDCFGSYHMEFRFLLREDPKLPASYYNQQTSAGDCSVWRVRDAE